MTSETEAVEKVALPGKPGRYLMHHPDVPMSPEQRAWEMWAVHPSDLDTFDMSREDYFLAHIRAAIEATRADEREACAKVAECHFDDRPHMGHDFRWHDGYEAGCRGAATAIRNRTVQP